MALSAEPTLEVIECELVSDHTRATSTEPALHEWLAYLLIIALCDWTIYRGHGYSGYSFALGLLPGLFLLGAPRSRISRTGIFIWLLIAALGLKMVWCGSNWMLIPASVLVGAFAYSLTGRAPHLIETIAFMLQTFVSGYLGIMHLAQTSLRKTDRRTSFAHWVNIGLPIATCLVFGTIFVLANPDLFRRISNRFELILTDVMEFMRQFSFGEVAFWALTFWISVGLMRPVLATGLIEPLPQTSKQGPNGSPLTTAFRNTLSAVAVLFGFYLVFEFQSLWFRTFPKGFHYSGYAHQGAAWLTVALALATLLMSLIFRGQVLGDARLPILRRLAWIWSIENFVLAVAVYHRLLIYVGFNGMSKMRMIGFFGITCVVVGFVLVLVKIARERNFLWLIRRQLVALGLAIVAFAITPVERIVMEYNVSQVLSGHLPPSVQISVHAYSAEGWLSVVPLTNCHDPTIREGARALLAKRQIECQATDRQFQLQGWTRFQLAEWLLLKKLDNHQSNWTEFKNDASNRDSAISKFDRYVYQWY